jgi:hypothetical protein
MQRIVRSGVLLGLVLAACTRVPAPTEDPSPPTLRWRIENLTSGSDVTIQGSGAVAAKVDENLRVTLIADDPQGIRRIEMGGGFVTSCRFPGAASAASGIYALQQQALSPDSSNMVLTSIFVLMDIPVPDECPAGGEFVSARVSLHGMGENYFSGKAQEGLEIQVAP